MAHYDCKNCGEYMGIDYGECSKCTPPEVFNAKSKYNHAYYEAKALWEEHIRKKKETFIAKYVKKAKKKYVNAYNDNAPKNVKKLKL